LVGLPTKRKETEPLLRVGPLPSFSHLTHIFTDFVKQAASSNMRPYALPANVAEVYLKDPQAYPEHECEKCCYRVPVTKDSATGTVKRYFPQCPLCGGEYVITG
jgi:hypothetical protein